MANADSPWSTTHRDGSTSTVHAASQRAAVTQALLNDRHNGTTTTHVTRGPR